MSSARTARGKYVAGKIQKLRADMLFLLMVTAGKRLIILTGKDMFYFSVAEKRGGRVPQEIEFVHLHLPETLVTRLLVAKKVASDEVSTGYSEYL
jgi:hypothetical protein